MAGAETGALANGNPSNTMTAISNAHNKALFDIASQLIIALQALKNVFVKIS
jgi:hypothetical protein